MRKLLLSMALCLFALPGPSFAQSNAVVVPCEACRDPLQYPDDYVNFAFNQIYGDEGWMDPEQADDFYIQSPDGALVYVDVDFVMHGIRFFGIDVPLWPDFMLRIRLALPNGLVIEAVRSVFLSPLPVPSSSGGETEEPEPTGGAESGPGEGVDEPEDPEPEDPIEWEPVGTTGIQDPDENGEFPDPDWCEEC